jgi:hypothetical protein
MKTIVLALLSLTALVPLSASARPYHFTPVSWIVATRNNIDVDDRYVTIIGHVTRRMTDEEYWFTDGTGQVRLDSENFDLPIGRRIVIGGRIDQAYLGFGHIEVDVRRWHYAPLRTATTVVTAVTHRAPAPAVHVTVPAASSTPVDAAPTPTPAPAPVTSTTTTTSTTATSAPTSDSPSGPTTESATSATTNGSPLTPPADHH